MKRKSFAPLFVLTFLLSLWLSTPHVQGQAVLSGTSWTENFDSLGSGLPTGWSVVKSAGAASLGTAVAFTTATTNWSATAGQFANFASTSDGSGTVFNGSESSATQAASPNRCLAVRQTSAQGSDPGVAFLFQIQDTMGFANFQLSLDLNMLSVQPRSTTWTIDYGLGSTPANFISLGTYSDPGAFGTTTKTFSFGNALDNQSQNVWIRIVALGASTGSGTRDTFGIDNFSLTYTPFSDTHTAPRITTQPPSRTTNNAGTSVTFTVAASGTAPFTYQWFKDGDYIYDNGMNISGAATAALTLTGVLAADAGAYSVQVSNPYGHATSSNAVLVVIDPLITVQPVSRTNVVGDTANFSVTAVGTPLVNYQWRFNGKEIDSATDSLLSLDDVQSTNTGAYSVVVSDSAGSITSTVAQLVVVQPPPNLLARWDFNDPSAPPSAPPPSVGTGTSTVVGSPVGSLLAGSQSDPAFISDAWQTTPYPSAATSNKTSGVQFNLSTEGYQSLFITWEQRNSATASKYMRVQYTINGTDFIDGPVETMYATNTTFAFFSADLSGIPDLNNNPNFGFRFVSEWEASATGSGTNAFVGTANTYGAAGTMRFDLVNVFAYPLGALVKIPLKISVVGTQAVVTWSNPALRLQSSSNPSPTAAWADVSGATSPYSTPLTGKSLFFRLVH